MSRRLFLQGREVKIGDIVWFYNQKVRVLDFKYDTIPWSTRGKQWVIEVQVVEVHDVPRPDGGRRLSSKKVGDILLSTPRRISIEFEPHRVYHCFPRGWSEYRWKR